MEIKGNEYKTGETVKFIRQAGNFKQAELAKKLNKSIGWLRDIEQGINRIYYSDFIKICEACNIEIILKEKK